MLNLPVPILGKVNGFTITTPDLGLSLAYYQKLGFTEKMQADWPFPWIQVTDGAIQIMLRKDNVPYIALSYYTAEAQNVVAMLEEKGVQFYQKAKDTDMVKRYFMRSPDGVNISLVAMEGFTLPEGPTMLTTPQQDYFNPDKYVNKVCGLFGEFAHPVTDLEKSLGFWQLLGFNTMSKFTSPYPWAIISDGLSVVGLHQTDKFSYPAITFFASDMKDKISRLKAEGLTDFKEQGPANIVLNTPEQQRINLFKLGM